MNDPIKKLGVAVVSPSSAQIDEVGLKAALIKLNNQVGYVENYFSLTRRFQRFADTDAARAAQLMEAGANPKVDIVMALRGGYGLSRILPMLDFEKLAASGKIFVGYSDFTALNLALLACGGGKSFTGPCVIDMACDKFSDFTGRHFWHCIFKDQYEFEVNHPQCESRVLEGRLWGGNLAMLVHLLGTPYFPNVGQGILFLEDVNEHPYKIERMLLQLLYAGVLDRQCAIVLGQFTGYELNSVDNGFDMNAVLALLRSRTTVPIFIGLPFGHTSERVSLPIGAHAGIESYSDGFRMSLSDYPNLKC